MEVDSNYTELVVHGSSQEVKLASPGGGRDIYAEDIQRVLTKFRRSAASLMFAQAELEDRQMVNQEHVMALFQVYAQAQRALQESTEQRARAALLDTRSEIVTGTLELVTATADGIKNDVELGVNAAVHQKLGVSFTPVKVAANERMQALSAVLGEQLTATM